MDAGEQLLFDLAQQSGIVSRKQAKALMEAYEQSPGQNLADLMLRNYYVTEEQMAQLRQMAAQRGPQMQTVAPRAQPAGQVREAFVPSPPSAPSAPAAKAPSGPANLPQTLPDYLAAARQWGCSDLHLCAGRPPFMRRFGDIHYLEQSPLSPERSRELNFSLLTESQAKRLDEEWQLDLALEVEGIGRHRCNMYKQRLGWDGAYRIIPTVPPGFEELGLPPALKTLTEYPQGMVLVTGPAGSGKTTTVAAMLDLINRSRSDHIITVEDPIEFILPSKECQVTQREVGEHTKGFATALRAALREDPDVILVGELRDLETISIAISASETGHLVFGTLHTTNAMRTVARLLDAYPPEQREQISTMVSESIRGVVSQLLLPRKDLQGMVLALEILLFTSGVAQQVRENKTHQLASLIQSGRKIGMRLMDDSLMELFQQGLITGALAWQYAENKPQFDSIRGK